MKYLTKYMKSGLLVLLLGTVVACGGNTEKETEKETEKVAKEQVADTTSFEAKLNINTASEEAFRTIPDVGDKMVHEFEEYRPYVSIRQFRKEIGKYVDEEQVAAYEEYIFVPYHRNDSDAATLQQIPGVDEKVANELIEGRPYETNEAFFEALSSHLNEEQLATAKKYIKAEK
ncbi:hypothetical protein [Fodinibius halophilus]|uniref:Helix-hairpin-helix domain-containing protein n=1 Tax=Fodinibius halophilus TaxID=1736908 RepID=A0A6M1T7K9_9BACT|nr:hypothetical protein [Fodinibius halophilus]NGP87114.1 hypothetical protein [Fodinibius halophilus]